MITINPQDADKFVGYIFGYDFKDNVYYRKSTIDKIIVSQEVKRGTMKFSEEVSKEERAKILNLL